VPAMHHLAIPRMLSSCGGVMVQADANFSYIFPPADRPRARDGKDDELHDCACPGCLLRAPSLTMNVTPIPPHPPSYTPPIPSTSRTSLPPTILQVIVGASALLAGAYWFLSARYFFRGPHERAAVEAERLAGEAARDAGASTRTPLQLATPREGRGGGGGRDTRDVAANPLRVDAAVAEGPGQAGPSSPTAASVAASGGADEVAGQPRAAFSAQQAKRPAGYKDSARMLK